MRKGQHFPTIKKSQEHSTESWPNLNTTHKLSIVWLNSSSDIVSSEMESLWMSAVISCCARILSALLWKPICKRLCCGPRDGPSKSWKQNIMFRKPIASEQFLQSPFWKDLVCGNRGQLCIYISHLKEFFFSYDYHYYCCGFEKKNSIWNGKPLSLQGLFYHARIALNAALEYVDTVQKINK